MKKHPSSKFGGGGNGEPSLKELQKLAKTLQTAKETLASYRRHEKDLAKAMEKLDQDDPKFDKLDESARKSSVEAETAKKNIDAIKQKQKKIASNLSKSERRVAMEQRLL